MIKIYRFAVHILLMGEGGVHLLYGSATVYGFTVHTVMMYHVANVKSETTYDKGKDYQKKGGGMFVRPFLNAYHKIRQPRLLRELAPGGSVTLGTLLILGVIGIGHSLAKYHSLDIHNISFIKLHLIIYSCLLA